MTLDSKLSASAAASRAGLRRIVVSGLIVAVMVLAGTLALVSYAADAIDRTQAAREQRLIAQSLQRTLARMRENVASSAVWDQGYSTLTPDVTAAWAQPNYGDYYADFMKQEVTVLFDSRGRYTFASRASETVPLAHEAPFSASVGPLVAAVRAESARKRFGPNGRRNVSFKAVANEEGLISVNGRLYLVAVSTIVPEHLAAALTFDGPDPVVASGRPMDDFLKSLTEDLSIHAPRLTAAGSKATGPKVPLYGPDGRALGEIHWTPERPGLELLHRAQPVIWSVVVALIAAALVLLARVLVMLRRLDENERNLTAARDAANAANEAKSQFLANMSHELRTPLNGIVAIAEVLRKRLQVPEEREMAGLIVSSSAVLEQVVNDILDSAKIESGQLGLEFSGFDIETCIHGIAMLHAASAADKRLDLAWQVSPRAAGAYVGDSTRLIQVISNLLSNAVKFTTEGYIRLTVRTGPRGLRIIVRDSGMGFNAEARARLFYRFEQADVSMTRRHGGTGLGLSICAGLVEAMGGEIDAWASPGKGAIFVVTLPLQRATSVQVLAQPAAPESDQTERPLRVLLAEDHPTNQRVISLILEPLGVDLTIVGDGAEAVKAAATGSFDLILMDVQMPVLDGLSATRQIREAETAQGRPRTPIVSLTAHAMGDHVAASLASGADRHMAKPIRPDVLIQTVIDMTMGGEDAAEASRAA